MDTLVPQQKVSAVLLVEKLEGGSPSTLLSFDGGQDC